LGKNIGDPFFFCRLKCKAKISRFQSICPHSEHTGSVQVPTCNTLILLFGCKTASAAFFFLQKSFHFICF